MKCSKVPPPSDSWNLVPLCDCSFPSFWIVGRGYTQEVTSPFQVPLPACHLANVTSWRYQTEFGTVPIVLPLGKGSEFQLNTPIAKKSNSNWIPPYVSGWTWTMWTTPGYSISFSKSPRSTKYSLEHVAKDQECQTFKKQRLVSALSVEIRGSTFLKSLANKLYQF